jgi:hypothetical protein
MTEKSKEPPKSTSDHSRKIPPIVPKPGGVERGYTEIINKADPKKTDSKNK